MQDVGLIDAVRKGRVEIVPAVESFEDGKVVLAGGDRIGPDAVIAATGYVRSLEQLVGHLGVLDARGKPVVNGARTPKDAPGLYFTGFTNPISGMLRELAIDAEKIAKAVAKETRRLSKKASKAASRELRPRPDPGSVRSLRARQFLTDCQFVNLTLRQVIALA